MPSSVEHLGVVNKPQQSRNAQFADGCLPVALSSHTLYLDELSRKKPWTAAMTGVWSLINFDVTIFVGLAAMVLYLPTDTGVICIVIRDSSVAQVRESA